jgi:hypothetical protein
MGRGRHGSVGIVTTTERVILAFRRGVSEICALLGCYVAKIYSYLTDVSGKPLIPILKGEVVSRRFGTTYQSHL